MRFHPPIPRASRTVRGGRLGTLLVIALLMLSAGPASAQGPAGPGIGPRHQPEWVSGPGPGDPVDRVREFASGNVAALGLEAEDLHGWRLTDRTTTRRNGVTHVYLQQLLAGIEVDGGVLSAHVMPDGRLFGLHNSFVPGLQAAANTRAPAISAAEAVAAAAAELGLAATQPLIPQHHGGGPAREISFDAAGLSLDPIPVKLVYHTEGEGDARLAWNLFVRTLDRQHWWNFNVDAVTGAVLRKTDWILNDSYRVLPAPLGSPDEGARVLDADPAYAPASPFGWHDTDGAAGSEFSDTRGNNVNAQEDADANNSGGFRPTGTLVVGDLVFDFPLDLHETPATSQSAAITNLFHWNNVLHDIHYQYGFDEASGNFQVNNYGKGGTGGDPVIADALDGSGLNNANFSRAPEGTSPRMQMYRFEHPGVTIHSPTALRQMLAGGTAEFGSTLTPAGVTGDVVQALDPPDAPLFSTTDGCSALTNAAEVSGKIALIDRGDCPFIQKVANAQAAGAIAALITNDAGDEVILMGGTDASITIPSLFIGQTHGAAIKAALAGVVNVTLSSKIERDGDLDNGIIVHEYGHGVSIRLSGGPSLVGCLGLAQSAGMGEGWSDFWALAITAKASDSPTDARPVGAYAQGEPPTGPGIRNFPYSTDLAVNPQTFASVDGTNQPHGVGEIWAQALWEVYWNLVGAHGFDPDFYSGTGGNNITLQLVMDALKTQGCDPTFLQARDAILMADGINNGGANQCLIWQAFAKRGMGVDADDTGNPRRLKVRDGFALPAACLDVCGNGVIDTGEQCDDGGTQAGDCCSPTCQNESAATQCRAAVDVCDVAEFCTGSDGACPADAVEADTTECRGAAGACDLAELCDGVGTACPADAKATSECRPASGSCDVAEVCDGIDDSCPADQVDVGLCGSGDACNAMACIAKECQLTPLADGTPCLDADLCNGDESCQAGVCSAGSPPPCDDGDACTHDRCEPAVGCINDPLLACQDPPVPVPAFPSTGGTAAVLALLGAALALSGNELLRRRRTERR